MNDFRYFRDNGADFGLSSTTVNDPALLNAIGVRSQMSLDELKIALKEKISNGNFAGAYSDALSLIETTPNDPEILEMSAVAAIMSGNGAKALEIQRKLVALCPNELRHCKNLIDFMRAVLGNTDEVLKFCSDTVGKFGPDLGLMNIWGLVAYNMERYQESVRLYEKTVSLYPSFNMAYRNMSLPLLALGRTDDAVDVYSSSLEPWDGTLPENQIVKIERDYNAMSSTYDENKLHQSFEHNMALFAVPFLEERSGLCVLDAACGTGSAGRTMKPFSAHVTGIDISPGLLAVAQSRNIYDDLIQGEIIAVMSELDRQLDVIVSSCALYHFADLEPFFKQSARLLDPGGFLFFGVDPASDDMEIGLSGPGEYAHSRRYLRGLAKKHGFHEQEIRIMEHRRYPGFLCAFSIPGS